MTETEIQNEEHLEADEFVKEKDPIKEPEKVIVPINKEGILTFNNQLELAKAASFMMRLKMAPPHLIKEGHEAVAAALVFCKQFNLPQKSMTDMAYIKGRITVYGTLFSSLAQRHRDFGEEKKFYVDDDIEKICVENKNIKKYPYAAVMQIRKKGSDIWNEYYFTMDDAKLAKLDNPTKYNGDPNMESPWRKYVRDMLMHKCRNRAYKSEYAAALEGIDYHEDLEEALQSPRDVTPEKGDALTQMNDALNSEFVVSN